MRWIVCIGIIAYAYACYGQEPVSVLVQETPRKVVIHNHYTSAQSHAEYLAANGLFGHCSRRGHGYEGIGMSPASPGDAVRRCCYWGQRRPREIGTAWCPMRRMWVAVVRYE